MKTGEKLVFHHYRLSTGNVTLCVKLPPLRSGDAICIGGARCSHKEQYNKAKGRLISSGRAVAGRTTSSAKVYHLTSLSSDHVVWAFACHMTDLMQNAEDKKVRNDAEAFLNILWPLL